MGKGEEGKGGHVKLNIRHERQKSKNRYANTRTHTLARAALPAETLPTHFFASATCQIFATDYASGKSETALVSDCVQCMSVCVCVYVCE